jgi:hypothetical protein
VLYIAFIGWGLKVYFESVDTRNALCTYRDDLQRRVTQNTQFLKDNPNGVAGIPSKVFVDSIANQQRAINSLQELNCPPPKPSIVTEPTPTSTK